MTESADASRTSKAIDFDAVARFYDAHVTTTVDLNFWVEQCQAHRGPRLELMCGSGRISLAVLAAGIDLCCVDYSRGLLARLSTRLERERGPGWGRAEIIEDDARSLAKLGARRFGLVFIGFHAIAELCEIDDLRACLERRPVRFHAARHIWGHSCRCRLGARSTPGAASASLLGRSGPRRT